MKKFLAVILALVLVFSFAACASSNGSGSSAETLLSADDAITWLDSVYAEVPEDLLPAMISSRELDLTDSDAVSYNTGLTGLDGISSIVVSESGIGSFAYSMVLISAEPGADAAAIQADLLKNINPAKWVCVEAESVISVTLDQNVLLVMGSEAQTEAILEAVSSAAEGVFTVGEATER